ncbi:MAG: YncE family protein [Acidobacteriota bacterium]
MLVVIASSFFGFATGQSGSASRHYHQIDKIVLGGEGTWDYPELDPKNRLIYISHETAVEVVNIDTGKLVRRIAEIKGVHGIVAVPELDAIFVTEGKADRVSVFAPQSTAARMRVETGKGPDAIVYDPATQRVFTSNGDSADMTAFDARSGKVLGTIALGGDPESITVNGKGLLWVAIADKNEVVNIDTRDLSVKRRIELPSCRTAKSIAVDDQHHRLFVGCRNKILAVINTKTGGTVTSVPIGDRVDSTIFDPTTGMIFNSNGDGTITVIHEDSRDRFTVVETIKSLPGAKTMAFDPKTKRLFLPVRDVAPPTQTVGTFCLLVFGR